MKFLLALLLSTTAFGQSIYLPNPGVKTALTGTIDNGLASANVHLSNSTGITVNQGSAGSIGTAWFVRPTDSVNSQVYLPDGSALVSMVGPLSTGFNVIGSVGQYGPWSMSIIGSVSVAVVETVLAPDAATASNQLLEIAALNSIAANNVSPMIVAQSTGAFLHVDVDEVFGAVNVIQSSGALLHVNVDSIGSIAISNFPAVQTVDGSTGRTWNLLETTDSVSSWLLDGFGNPISSTLNALNVNISSGSIAISNFPAIQTIDGSTGRTWNLNIIDDSVGAAQYGQWDITNITGSVALPTGAATSALQIVGNDSIGSINTKLNSDYGASSGAIRVASQIGNSTGQASFGSGVTDSQTLRVTLPTDQAAINVNVVGGSIGGGSTGTAATFRFSSFFPVNGSWVCPAGVTEVILAGSGGASGGGGGGGGGGSSGTGGATPGGTGTNGTAGTAGGDTTFVSGAVTRTFAGGAANAGGTGGTGGIAAGSPGVVGNGVSSASKNNLQFTGELLASIYGNRIGKGSNGGSGGPAGSSVGGPGAASGGTGGMGGATFSTTQRVAVIPGNTYTITIGLGGNGGAGGAGGVGGGGGGSGGAGGAAPTGTSIEKPSYIITQQNDSGYDGSNGSGGSSGGTVGGGGGGGGSGGKGADGFLMILWDAAATP